MIAPMHRPAAGGTFRRREKRQVASTAQMIEAAVMLLVVTCALGVTTFLLASAASMVRASETAEAATRAAANAAEVFSADPASAPSVQKEGDLTVCCSATPEPHSEGTLWRAHITVSDADGATVYELDTARYVAATGSSTAGQDSRAQGGAA